MRILNVKEIPSDWLMWASISKRLTAQGNIGAIVLNNKPLQNIVA